MFWAIIAVLGVLVVYFAAGRKSAKAPTVESSPKVEEMPASANSGNQADKNSNVKAQPSDSNQNPLPQSPKPVLGTFSGGEGDAAAPDIVAEAVDYDGSGFSPVNITIKVNDYIFFRNNGTKDFWPASDPHPQHTNYAGFDAGQPVAPGKTFKFQFTKAGTWGYHDHLNPSALGIVTVNPK